MFIGMVHLNGVCGICDVGVVCAAHVCCVCVCGQCVMSFGDTVLSVVFVVYMLCVGCVSIVCL